MSTAVYAPVSASAPSKPDSTPDSTRGAGPSAKPGADPRPQTGPSPSINPSGFCALGLSSRLDAALTKTGITAPFPIQTASLPDSLAGRDVLGRGRTGSGKTHAFVLPILDRLAASQTTRRPGRPRALILAPTRELAAQIDATMKPLARAMGFKTLTVFGGVGAQPQITGLRNGVDVLVACPGRLADHLQSGHVHLDSVEITVLDEADHMADLGFLPVVRRLLDRTPRDGQRLLFSATLDAGVDVLVKRYLSNPVTHSVDSVQSPVSAMSHHVLHVGHDARLPVLVDLTSAPGRTLVFTRTKHGAKSLAGKLTAAGVPAVELHGNLSQAARTRNLAAFARGSARTLVATDIAARGIHVDDVALVVHADPPVEHKAYLHRSGRTARAGNAGTVVTLMTDAQVRDVRDLTRKAGVKPTTTRLSVGHPLLDEIAPGQRTLTMPAPGSAVSAANAGRGGGRGSRGVSTGGSRRRTWSAKRPERSGRRTSSEVRGSSSAAPAGQRSQAPRRREASHAAMVSSGSGGAASFSSATRRNRRGDRRGAR
ncbi:MAG: DEAD/DEAH box helicase [Nocardioidaceae bacterium]